MLREMAQNDWAQVAAIYTQGLETGTATFNTDCPSYEEWDRGHVRECRLVFVAEEKVVGWAALSPMSSRYAYRGCAELSVYVDTAHQGRGIGTALVRALSAKAQEAGFWSLYVSVMSINAASIALHKKCSFREIGYRERVARDRFGVWQNTTLLELRLED